MPMPVRACMHAPCAYTACCANCCLQMANTSPCPCIWQSEQNFWKSFDCMVCRTSVSGSSPSEEAAPPPCDPQEAAPPPCDPPTPDACPPPVSGCGGRTDFVLIATFASDDVADSDSSGARAALKEENHRTTGEWWAFVRKQSTSSMLLACP